MYKPTYRIALVANTTWNIYNFRLNVIRKLLDEGHEVLVFAPVDKYISYQEKFHKVKHIPLKKLKRDSVNPLRDLQLTGELTRLYSKFKPDLVVHYTVKPNIFGGIAARLAGVPSIAVVTGLGYAFLHNGIVQKTTASLYKLTSGYQKKMIFENNDDLELFIDNGLVGAERGVSVNGCGVDTEVYKPDPNISSETDDIIFTFVGRLLYDKGIREFVEAAHIVQKEYENVKFWVFGELDRDNPSAIRERDLVAWVKDETIEYHGAKDDIRQYLQRSDCVVLPSYREGMSRVIMEAMAMERPVITSDTPGCRQAVVHGQNGLLVPVRDVESLAIAMREFLGMSPEERRKLGLEGRDMAVRLFDEHIVADQILGIIQEVLNDVN